MIPGGWRSVRAQCARELLVTQGALMHAENMSSSASPNPGTLRLLRLFLWLHSRSFLARFAKSRQESPLLVFVLSAFMLGYLLFGFWLFRSGLQYLYKFPLVGTMLAERILYLIFGFFFIMLVVSNLIIGYSLSRVTIARPC